MHFIRKIFSRQVPGICIKWDGVKMCVPYVFTSFCFIFPSYVDLNHVSSSLNHQSATISDKIMSANLYIRSVHIARSRYQGISRAGTGQILWDVITCPYPWYLRLARHSSSTKWSKLLMVKETYDKYDIVLYGIALLDAAWFFKEKVMNIQHGAKIYFVQTVFCAHNI